MTYKISEDRKTLTISVDEAEREYLHNWNDEEPSLSFTGAEAEFLEPLIGNSELEWINPADTGDLTDAPMLGILGDAQLRMQAVPPSGPFGIIKTGFNGHADSFQPILERWAFLDYQVRSVLEDLRDKGECVFIS